MLDEVITSMRNLECMIEVMEWIVTKAVTLLHYHKKLIKGVSIDLVHFGKVAKLK